ncbi:MAG: YHYH protein, partial [Candidatus Neomarinimicrobiota bacterium]|nr:YHYH protein [Candidatus Neomarinimicrobiota bacterium]
PIGVSINGVPFFNEYESPTETLTNQVIQSFDPGNGHPAPQGRYHYHFPPESLITVTEDNFLGFAGDGFPVYGPKNPDGNNAQNLDDYHGEFGPTPDFPDSIYHYHTNFSSPYIIGAFAGTIGTGFGGGGGGGGGGLPPNCDQVPPGMPCCGDGNCGGPETETNCPEDCATTIDYTIIVNEFMAANQNCCDDGTGENEDFIELYNYGMEAIDIGGFYFTDNLTGSFLYHITDTSTSETTISGGEFLVIWADADPEQGPLHVDFKLSSGGEDIGIYDPDGSAIIEMSFSSQGEDTSYGRYPDGSDTWQFMNPTPGMANTQELSLVNNITMPGQFKIHQNYPNPFNPVTTIRYDLPENSLVNITIYDMLGKQVTTLINQTQDAGYRSVIWDATNDYGKPVSAGIYLSQIHAGEYISTKKIVLLK